MLSIVKVNIVYSKEKGVQYLAVTPFLLLLRRGEGLRLQVGDKGVQSFRLLLEYISLLTQTLKAD